MKNRAPVGYWLSLCIVLGLLLLTLARWEQAGEVEIRHPPGDFAIVGGARLWYESEGKGEPLLLIAGGPGLAHGYFHPHFSGLADSNRVIYFDALGRGKSDRAKRLGEYTFDRDVEEIEGLRKALKLGSINLLGHSYGGMVAQAYALKYPGSVRRLVLANTLFSGEMWQANNDSCNFAIRNQCPEVWGKLEQVRAKGYRCSAKEHQEVYFQAPLGLVHFYNPANADTFERAVQQDFSTEIYFAIGGEDADFHIGGDIAKLDFRNRLKDLKMPTLVIMGRYDRVSVPRYALQFKEYAPQAQCVMFEKSGHFPFIEENAETLKVLREFLSK